MGTSLLDWVQDLHGRGLFAADARVFGLTSEGNALAWKGYAAVSAAKVALEALARSIAMEFAPHGIRCNVLQPGVTETPALGGDPGERASEGVGAAPQPLRAPHDAAGRRERGLPAVPRRGGLGQRRADPRRRRRARVGVHRLTLFLHGVGHFHPENEITNRFLEELEHRHERRLDPRARRDPLAAHGAAPRLHPRDAEPRRARGAEAALYDTAELGRRAAERALARAGIGREATSAWCSPAAARATSRRPPRPARSRGASASTRRPSTSAPPARASWRSSALLSMMRPEALPPFVLLVVQEALTRTVDYTDRATAVLFGDAAAAAVVSTRVPGRARILHAALDSDPSAADKVSIPRLAHFAPGRARGADVRHPEDARPSGTASSGLRGDEERPLHLVGHQANLRVLARRLRARRHRPAAPPQQRRALRQHRRAERAQRASPRSSRSGAPRTTSPSSASAPASAGGAAWCASRPRHEVRRVPARATTSSADELLAFAWGRLVEDAPAGADLPAPGAADADGRPRDGDPPRGTPRARRGRARRAPRRLVLPVPLHERPGAAGLPRRRRRLAAPRLLLHLGGRPRLGPRPRLRRDRVLRPDPAPRPAGPLRDRRAPLLGAPGGGLRDRDRRRHGARRRRADLHAEEREVRPLPRHRLRATTRTRARTRGAGGSCRERDARSPS